MRLCSLSLFVVLHTVSNGSRYGNIEAIVYFNLLCAMTTALIGSVYDNLTDKLMHDLRCQLSNMLILLYCLNDLW